MGKCSAMDIPTKQRYTEWKTYPHLALELKKDLDSVDTNSEELEKRFGQELEFGTGGLRGILGAGTNRMNIYTVAKATRGLTKYLKSTYPSPSCAIAFDSRNKSREFAAVAAEILARADIRVWYYEELTPTPMLSFAVRHLHCSAGIVITASHNPPMYNGYKVYGPDGCQITLEAASHIQACIAAQPMFPYETERKEGYFPIGENLQAIENDVIEAYYSAILSLNIRRPLVPLHVSIKWCRKQTGA